MLAKNRRQCFVKLQQLRLLLDQEYSSHLSVNPRPGKQENMLTRIVQILLLHIYGTSPNMTTAVEFMYN